MHGFKSFAKHSELVFGPKFNVILGPNGSGKCLKGDSKVYLGDGSLVSIGKIVDEKINKNNTKRIDDGFIADGDSTEILCLDTKSLKIRKKKIQAYVKRTSPRELLSIRTKTGRTITSTAYHPLFVMDGENIRSIKAEELKEGVRIAVPRKLVNTMSGYFYDLIDEIRLEDGLYVPYSNEYKEELIKLKKSGWGDLARKLDISTNVIKGLLDGQAINFTHLIRILKTAKWTKEDIISSVKYVKSKTSSKLCKIPWENSKEFARLLGYLIAEGRLTESNQVWFTNGCEELVEDYVKIVKNVFGLTSTINEYKPNCYDVLVYSRPMEIILSKFGMSFRGTEDKEVKNIFLKNASKQEIAEFLNGLYCGDGYVSPNSIEITTKSKKLAKNIELMLSRIGIIFNSKYVVKTATNSGFSGIYKQISFYGVNNFKKFSEKVEFTHPKKQQKLISLLDKKANPNQDLIESNSLIKQVSRELGINVKKQKKVFPRIDSYVYNQCTPSRYGINHLIEELFLPSASSKSMQNLVSLQKLNLITKSDILWDEIVEIRRMVSKEEWVYDLCVEEDHNFIAENIFVHNSNVLDAICFVLGKTSAKSLRAEKSSNLIYNGGKAKSPAKQGEVSIYFDNKEKTFPTEEEEVKLTRIVRQNGQSIYKINDNVRTREQILDLMRIAKIDPDGYNIILQGDIIKFVEMSPIERRMLIEDISGISMYEDKKRKAMLEMEKVEKKLNDAEIVLKERSTYLKELKKDRDQALKFKEMNEKINMYRASLLKLQIDKRDNEKKELDEKLAKTKEEMLKIQEKIKKLNEENDAKKDEVSNISKEIEEKGEVEQVNLNKEVEALKIELTRNDSRLTTIKNELTKISKRREDLNSTIKETEENIASLVEEKERLKKEYANKENEKKELDVKVKAFREKNNIDNLSELDKQIEDIDKKAEEMQKEIHGLREQQHNMIREKDSVQHQINTIDEQIKKVAEVEKEHQKEIDDLKNKKDSFKKSTLELNKRLNEDSSLASQIGDARAKAMELNEKLASLQARNVTIREASLGNVAVKKIISLKKNGVYGTVSELGNVNSKYALALEIAAGPRIKSIVVEDDKVASECIKYLKQNKLGTATFLPLSKLKTKKIDDEIKKLSGSNGCHGMAINLVEYDNKFKKVFEYVFANTIVVDNIDVTRRLGIGKAKMVTLDGDTAEVSGAMHGGYRDKKRKGMGFKEKDLSDDIDGYEKRINELESTIITLEKRRKENEEQIDSFRQTKAELEGEIIVTEKSLHLESSDLDVNKIKKEELIKQQEAVDKKNDELVDIISEKNRSLAGLKIEKQNLRGKITSLRNPSLLAEISTFEEKLRQFNEDMLTLNSEMKNIDVQVDTIHKPEVDKVHEIIKQINVEETKFKKEGSDLSSEMKDKQKMLDEKEAQAKVFYAKFKELFAKQSKINDEIKNNEITINKKREESVQIEIRSNTLSLKSAETNSALAGLKQEFTQYEGVQLSTEKNWDQLKYEISKFEKTKNEIGFVNMKSLEIYDEVEKEYNSLLEKKESLSSEREDVVKLMEEIEGKKTTLFMKHFNIINEQFKKIFSALSSKGEAFLELEEPDNVFEGGLRVKVKISGVKFMDIRSLSGGEKTMTALAFIFAIQEHEPASFYVLDEVDAALDKHNSEKLAKLVSQYSDRAQYVMISHNDNVISRGDNLYGVSMNEHGITKVVSLKI